jgi:hypothetical protein
VRHLSFYALTIFCVSIFLSDHYWHPNQVSRSGTHRNIGCISVDEGLLADAAHTLQIANVDQNGFVSLFGLQVGATESILSFFLPALL